MSAYVQPIPHINALVRLALEGPTGVPVNPSTSWRPPYFAGGRLDHTRADELGTALLRENVRSVNYRYEKRGGKLPTYEYNGGRRLTVPEAIMAIRGYEYQACERPDFDKSEVHAFLHRLLASVAARVPGVEEADTWSITSDAGAADDIGLVYRAGLERARAARAGA
jgi:hypothetical protein